jgi:hypothetical protein
VLRLQFSLRWLLGLVAFVAVGCAALIHVSGLCASLVFSTMLGILSVAILGSIFQRGAA